MPAEVSDQPTAEYTPEGAEILDEQRAAAVVGEPPFAAGKRGGENRLIVSLKDSLVAAAVTVALAGPLVGLQTLPGAGSRLAVNQRSEGVAAIVAVVFAFRMALNLLVWRTEYPITAGIARIFSNERMHAADWIIVAVIAAILVGLTFVATELADLLVLAASVAFVGVVGRKIFAAYIPALPYARIFGGLFLLVAVTLPLIANGLVPDQLRYI